MTATATNAGSVTERDWTVHVGGRPLPAAGRCDVEDPATGRVLTTVPDLSPGEVDQVIRAAAVAQRAWALLPARARGAKVRQFASVLRDHAPELATLDAVDAGFTLPVMLADVEAAAILLEIMADHALALGGGTYPLIRRIGFIGAPDTGRLIQREAAAAGVKYVSLELGGKNALVIMPDADLAKAADSAVAGMNYTATAGQSCGSTSRLLLHESIADQVLENVVEQVRAVRVGHPLADGTQMGPVIDRKAYDKSLGTIGHATAAGAAVLAGGGRPDTVGPDGWYVAPTVLGRMTPDNPAAVQEIFGPVLSVLTFRDEEEAVRIANQSEYGLTAGVWTSDVTRAHRLAARLEAGYVWVNGSSRHYWGLPFGGVKASGVGREESVDELLSYTETKAVTVVL